MIGLREHAVVQHEDHGGVIVPAASMGTSTLAGRTPPADIAVISLASASSEKAYSTATSTDMGMVSASVWGSERSMNPA